MNLKKQNEKLVVRPDQLETLLGIRLPRIVDSLIVDAAKLKPHNITLVALGMKNRFGLRPDKWKFEHHRRGIDKL